MTIVKTINKVLHLSWNCQKEASVHFLIDVMMWIIQRKCLWKCWIILPNGDRHYCYYLMKCVFNQQYKHFLNKCLQKQQFISCKQWSCKQNICGNMACLLCQWTTTWPILFFPPDIWETVLSKQRLGREMVFVLYQLQYWDISDC